MSNLSSVREHMEIIGADGVHVGVVDKVEGGRIKLTRDNAEGHHHGRHHFIRALPFERALMAFSPPLAGEQRVVPHPLIPVPSRPSYPHPKQPRIMPCPSHPFPSIRDAGPSLSGGSGADRECAFGSGGVAGHERGGWAPGGMDWQGPHHPLPLIPEPEPEPEPEPVPPRPQPALPAQPPTRPANRPARRFYGLAGF